MRKIAFTTLVALSLFSVAEAANIPSLKISQPLQSDVIQVENFNSRSAPSQNNSDRRRPTRFVCVITPPDSANRSRPYVCPVQQGRVGGRCRCDGAVGSGNIDTAW